jgi:predicted 3-demethylubiquinone-9 3-methyltransferase (glyoxalase superfamily)
MPVPAPGALGIHMPKITPFLWFDTQAEQAVRFYTSVFKGSKILAVSRYGKGMPGKAGSVMTVKFRLLGQVFTALNAGPAYKFNPSVSFVVHCKTQKEVDYYWRRLTSGGKEVQCGWLQDKYGLSWQIVPDMLMKVVTGTDQPRIDRMMGAMMKMVKLDIAVLEKAAAGKQKARH